MRIGAWVEPITTAHENDSCLCGQLGTREHHMNAGIVVCDACAYASALEDHAVSYRRDGNQVVAIVPYTDASGSTGVEEITITSPLHLMRVLGY